MQCWQKKSISDSKQCWSKTEGRVVDLVINSWRCSKQVKQLIRFTEDHLKLICASAMAMVTWRWCLAMVSGDCCESIERGENYVTVEIKWDRECLREGDSETSRDKLMRSKWNSSEHEQGTWRENLHHMVKTVEDLWIIMGYHCEVTVFSFQLDKVLHSVYEHFKSWIYIKSPSFY